MRQMTMFVLGLAIAMGTLSACSNDNEETKVCDEENLCEGELECIAGTCKLPLTLGDDCTPKDSFCKESVCKDGVCTITEDEIPACSLDNPCQEGMQCNKGVCKTKVAVGGVCDVTTFCVDGTCELGICRGGVELGEPCSKPEACAVGHVCKDETCQMGVPIGGQCSEGKFFCKEGSCIGGACLESDSDAALRLIDSDGDTISDYYDRCDEDTDGDTIPNCMDLDSDDDTIPDSMEAYNGGVLSVEPMDSDFDGVPDFLDLDSDSNGIPDAVEGKREIIDPDSGDTIYEFIDTDGDTILDSSDFDNDGDGVSDIYEIRGYPKGHADGGEPGGVCGHHNGSPGTPEDPWDCDGDTIPDYNDPDSDGDTILDIVEGLSDSDGDGLYDRYVLDSDGDTIPDSVESGGVNPPLASFDNVYDFQTDDIDSDGLLDGFELDCPNLGIHARYSADTDGDGYNDASEYAAAMASDGKFLPADLICNPAKGVKDVFDFYFELPYEGSQKDDTLLFKPAVSKLDVIFNVDTTGSMGGTISSVKNGINGIISRTRAAVSDSGFGLTVFDDFPIAPYGYQDAGDLPFRLLGPVSTDAAIVTSYTKDVRFKTRSGYDEPESGVEALYQIATGAGVAWTGGSIPSRTPSLGRWGGVDFRMGTLPVVVHVTDATSHDKDFASYASGDVANPHYTPDLMLKLEQTGIRVIGLDVRLDISPRGRGDDQGQLTKWSKGSNAIVPVCAFKSEDGTWGCGGNRCCTSDVGEVPVGGQCVLKFDVAEEKVAENISVAVDALVKYGVYDVSTVIRRDPSNEDIDTSCFIKQVSALKYIAPPQEPEKSCNPKAKPSKVGGADYNNGFSNFATGTSNVERPGANLEFKVLAQNDRCVEPTDTAQVFKAYIDVINPTTGLIFGTRVVSIIVPPKKQGGVN